MRNYLEHKTGKLVTNQDIHNLKWKVSTTEECDVHKVVTLLTDFLEDEANVVCVVLDDDEKAIELIYIQSSY